MYNKKFNIPVDLTISWLPQTPGVACDIHCRLQPWWQALEWLLQYHLICSPPPSLEGAQEKFVRNSQGFKINMLVLN